MLILGLWLNKERPIYDILIHESTKELMGQVNNGKVSFIINNIALRVQAVILDLPAKAAVTNIKQFNGYFGCSHCHQPGEKDFSFKKWIYFPNGMGSDNVHNVRTPKQAKIYNCCQNNAF